MLHSVKIVANLSIPDLHRFSLLVPNVLFGHWYWYKSTLPSCFVRDNLCNEAYHRWLRWLVFEHIPNVPGNLIDFLKPSAWHSEDINRLFRSFFLNVLWIFKYDLQRIRMLRTETDVARCNDWETIPNQSNSVFNPVAIYPFLQLTHTFSRISL